MNFFKKIKKGFTIVELVIVIAVIAVLTAILVPTFINLSKKANKASDESFKNYLNKALALVENDPELNTNGENVTMHYAIEDLNAYGIALNKIVTKSDEKLVWKLSENKFYFESEIKTDADRLGCWKIQNSIQEGQKFSVYAGEGFGTSAVVDGVGFDTGYKDTIETVIYTNSGSEKTVVIRTGSSKTNLSINAEHDTIKHYGPLGSLNVIKANTASYHEFGKVAYAEISYGRIVLESGSDVEEIHINSKDDSSFDTVIITNNGGEEELPDRITRDAVTVTDETLVVTVESNGSSENVYVYADSDTGTKGSTEQTSTQNTGVNSALGQLVLDNGSEGDKAQTADEKEAAKEAVVEEAINNEEVEKAEDAGYEVTHHDAVAPTCTEDGHTAYDSYFVNAEEVRIGYKVIPATGHTPDEENGQCTVCHAQVYYYKVGSSLFKSNEFSSAWAAAKNSGLAFKLLTDKTLYALQVDGAYILDLNGHTLTLNGYPAIGSDGTTGAAIFIDGGGNWAHGNLTLQNGNLVMNGSGYSTYGIYNYGSMTLKDLTITSSCENVIYSNGQAWASSGTVELDNVTINSTHSSGTAVSAYALKNWAGTIRPTMTIKNSTINAANNAVMIYGCDTTVENCTITATNNDALWIQRAAMASGVTGTLTVKGNTTVNAGSDYKRVHAQDSNTIVVIAGTYNFDPTSYVDSNSFDIAESDGVWTVSAK